jgi:AcrR family transcriptional regulator
MSDTKDKILDAAEGIFADHGYGGASLRAIITAAAVNLAAVHYHFGSKEKLLTEVIRRRAAPVNEERLRLLDECERAAGDGPPDLERVLEAFLAPAARMAARHPLMVRLLGRLYLDHMLGGIVREEFSDVVERFGAALRRALPELPEGELLSRAFLAIGVVGQAFRGPQGIPGMAGRIEGFHDPAGLARLIDFLAAGFRAPVRQTAAREA